MGVGMGMGVGVGSKDGVKVSDRCFWVVEARRVLEGNLRKWGNGEYLGLFRCF